jgi:hypothetical protein
MKPDALWKRHGEIKEMPAELKLAGIPINIRLATSARTLCLSLGLVN